MSLQYWANAGARVALNVVTDAKRRDGERFAFTKRLLRSGYEFDGRMRAPSHHFLDLYPEAEGLTLTLGDLNYTRSNATPLEMYCLMCIAQFAAPERIFEIGTFDGATTLRLALACPEAEVMTLDLDPGSINLAQPATIAGEVDNVRSGGVGSKFRGVPAAKRIHQLLGDSTTFDYAPYEGSIDLVFIDACHDYRFVKSDTANALRMVRNGVILWHDYHPGWPGVVQAVDELLPEHPVMHIAGTTLAMLQISGS